MHGKGFIMLFLKIFLKLFTFDKYCVILMTALDYPKTLNTHVSYFDALRAHINGLGA
jgi:hypothetical protein